MIESILALASPYEEVAQVLCPKVSLLRGPPTARVHARRKLHCSRGRLKIRIARHRSSQCSVLVIYHHNEVLSSNECMVSFTHGLCPKNVVGTLERRRAKNAPVLPASHRDAIEAFCPSKLIWIGPRKNLSLALSMASLLFQASIYCVIHLRSNNFIWCALVFVVSRDVKPYLGSLSTHGHILIASFIIMPKGEPGIIQPCMHHLCP